MLATPKKQPALVFMRFQTRGLDSFTLTIQVTLFHLWSTAEMKVSIAIETIDANNLYVVGAGIQIEHRIKEEFDDPPEPSLFARGVDAGTTDTAEIRAYSLTGTGRTGIGSWLLLLRQICHCFGLHLP